MPITPEDILDFWYSPRAKEKWFSSTPEFDSELSEKYADTWQSAAEDKLHDWSDTPTGCLALAIVLDQFPLNMFRGQPKSFQTEEKAREVARQAITKGFDKMLPKERLAFLYMPFMHSETLSDQEYSVSLFEAAELLDNIFFARHHHELIRRFGRFPHRNRILERASTKEELEYLNSSAAFNG